MEQIDQHSNCVVGLQSHVDWLILWRQTGAATSAVADGAGVFSVQYLLPGPYTVSVEAKGFQKDRLRPWSGDIRTWPALAGCQPV